MNKINTNRITSPSDIKHDVIEMNFLDGNNIIEIIMSEVRTERILSSENKQFKAGP